MFYARKRVLLRTSRSDCADSEHCERRALELDIALLHFVRILYICMDVYTIASRHALVLSRSRTLSMRDEANVCTWVLVDFLRVHGFDVSYRMYGDLYITGRSVSYLCSRIWFINELPNRYVSCCRCCYGSLRLRLC